MATSLADWVVRLMGDNSHLTAELNNVKAQLDQTKLKMRELEQARTTPRDLDATRRGLGGLAHAAEALKNQLLGLAGINLADVLKFGSLVGVVGAVGMAVKKFANLSDETFNVQNRFRAMGMEVDANTQRFFALGREIAATTTLTQEQGRQLAMLNLQHGAHPEDFARTTRASVGLAEALGVNVTQAARYTEMIEAGNYQILARQPMFREMIRNGASRNEIEAKLNDLIASGNEMALQRKGSFGGQLADLRKNLGQLGQAFASVAGQALMPSVTKFMDVVGSLSTRLLHPAFPLP
jgi:hypothetical protein